MNTIPFAILFGAWLLDQVTIHFKNRTIRDQQRTIAAMEQRRRNEYMS